MEKDLVGISLTLSERERREVSLVTVPRESWCGALLFGIRRLAGCRAAAPACAPQAGTRGPGELTPILPPEFRPTMFQFPIPLMLSIPVSGGSLE